VKHLLLFLALLCGPGLEAQSSSSATSPTISSAQALFERANDAYRRGAWDEAELSWQALLEDPGLAARDRARIALGLGNAAWRQEREMEAIGWYTLARRLDPWSEDARANLELARAKQGLQPAERGDLRSTLARLARIGRPEERRWAVLGALGLLAVTLAGEALRGGAAWRRAALGAALVLLVCAIPWLWGLRAPPAGDLLVVAEPAAALRSEPRPTLDPIGQAAAGDEVRRIDALPGWVRVEEKDGTRGWVPERAVFELVR
jgi:hypothetical protein